MDKKNRRKLEMGKRALKFARVHSDSNPQYVAAVARLEALLARAAELEMEEKKQRQLAENGLESLHSWNAAVDSGCHKRHVSVWSTITPEL